jgi:hypothetical protein
MAYEVGSTREINKKNSHKILVGKLLKNIELRILRPYPVYSVSYL